MELTGVSVTLMKLKPGIVCVCTCTCARHTRAVAHLWRLDDNFMSCFSPRPNSGYQAILLPPVLLGETFLLSIPPIFVCCGCVLVCACEIQKSTLVVITQYCPLFLSRISDWCNVKPPVPTY